MKKKPSSLIEKNYDDEHFFNFLKEEGNEKIHSEVLKSIN